MEHHNIQLQGVLGGVLGCVLTIALNLVHYVPAVNEGLHIAASIATICSACTTIYVLIYKLKNDK